MCGPVLGSLLLSAISPSKLFVEGDSKYIIGLVERAFQPKESFLMNAVDITLDMLHEW